MQDETDRALVSWLIHYLAARSEIPANVREAVIAAQAEKSKAEWALELKLRDMADG